MLKHIWEQKVWVKVGQGIGLCVPPAIVWKTLGDDLGGNKRGKELSQSQHPLVGKISAAKRQFLGGGINKLSSLDNQISGGCLQRDIYVSRITSESRPSKFPC